MSCRISGWEKRRVTEGTVEVESSWNARWAWSIVKTGVDPI
jgi:hypothetical protein